jgi:hypothetical protein
MNHTMITAAIVTVLATLVAGSGAFTTTAQSSADAYNKNDHNGYNAAAADGNSQEETRETGRPEPGECEACFDPLTAAQKSGFEDIVQRRSSIVFGTNITTIEQLCTFLRNIVLQERDPMEAIERIQSMLMDVEGVSSGTVSNITSCIQRAIE